MYLLLNECLHLKCVLCKEKTSSTAEMSLSQLNRYILSKDLQGLYPNVAHFREMKSSPCETFNIINNVRPLQTPPPHKNIDVIFARSHKNSG